jgi:hypothetical protein
MQTYVALDLANLKGHERDLPFVIIARPRELPRSLPACGKEYSLHCNLATPVTDR